MKTFTHEVNGITSSFTQLKYIENNSRDPRLDTLAPELDRVAAELGEMVTKMIGDKNLEVHVNYMPFVERDEILPQSRHFIKNGYRFVVLARKRVWWMVPATKIRAWMNARWMKKMQDKAGASKLEVVK